MFNFAIFKAKEKKSEKSPDYTSKVKVESEVVLKPGVEYQLAGWIKTPKSGGEKYISVVIKEKDTSYSSHSSQPEHTQDYGDDDIPF